MVVRCLTKFPSEGVLGEADKVTVFVAAVGASTQGGIVASIEDAAITFSFVADVDLCEATLHLVAICIVLTIAQ